MQQLVYRTLVILPGSQKRDVVKADASRSLMTDVHILDLDLTIDDYSPKIAYMSARSSGERGN